MTRIKNRSFALATAALMTVVAVFAGATPAARAHHITFKEQHTFETFMDASQVIPGHPAGSIRAVLVCTDGLNANPGAKTTFRTAAGDWNVAAGFQAFWLVGSGEFFGPCNGSQQMNVYWTTTSSCAGAWVGCNEAGPSDAYGGMTSDTIRINSNMSYSTDGLRGVMTHELGHAFGLWEQYVEDTGACGSQTSIMESATLSGGVVVSLCGAIQTQPFDYNNVQGAFDKTFGSTPQPQVLWILPMSSTTVRLVFKTPLVSTHPYERMLCGGYYPTGQTPGAINHDVGYVDFPMPSSGTSLCVQWRVVGGAGSSTIHLGRLTTSRGDVDGGWATIYSMSSQEAYMLNNSTTQSIPYTSVGINVSPYSSYPLCTQNTAIGPHTVRYCNIESYGAGTYFWFSQDHSTYDVMNVP